MIHRLGWLSVFFLGVIGFNALNASKVPMQKIAGKWTCTLVTPDGMRRELVETMRVFGDSWGSITSKATGSDGAALNVEMSLDASWSATETTLTHRYKKASIIKATRNGVDLGAEWRAAQTKGMVGIERVSKITELTETSLRYENEGGKVACTREKWTDTVPSRLSA